MRATSFSAGDAERLYNMAHWGAGYFAVTPEGELAARHGDGRLLPLGEIVAAARARGLRLPLLLRFSHILADRVTQLQGAFDRAIEAGGYGGTYTPVYPIKVNQQASVVKRLIASGRIGLEAGSKPELLAVLGLLPAGRPIICNGYKDREYIELGLLGQELGHSVTLVIEKLSELAHIFALARERPRPPQLGLRVRLASIGAGHWQNTGGEKAKFGLSAGQVEEALAALREQGRLDCLHLLHFHLGSQVANLRDIRSGLREAARYYVELRRLGAPIDTVDIGGGLGVDYEGTRSRSYCSMNYGLDDYARAAVEAFAEAAQEAGEPYPDIISESGRALTAHHAVLISNVIDSEAADAGAPQQPAEADPPRLWELWHLSIDTHGLPALERLADAQSLIRQLYQDFSFGTLSIAQRALGDGLYRAICRAVLNELQPGIRAHREALDQLQERFADQFFVNLSVFQSLPDVWAIDQVFPIVPLSRLTERPDRRALIRDLTCDSDGRIDHYVDRDGIESSLPVHGLRAGEDYLLGFFMVGAYQEILGDMHNLFGDTDTAQVDVAADGSWQFGDVEQGDRVDELLSYVHLRPDELLTRYREKIAASDLPETRRAEILETLKRGLAGYTYLT